MVDQISAEEEESTPAATFTPSLTPACCLPVSTAAHLKGLPVNTADLFSSRCVRRRCMKCASVTRILFFVCSLNGSRGEKCDFLDELATLMRVRFKADPRSSSVFAVCR